MTSPPVARLPFRSSGPVRRGHRNLQQFGELMPRFDREEVFLVIGKGQWEHGNQRGSGTTETLACDATVGPFGQGRDRQQVNRFPRPTAASVVVLIGRQE